MKGLFLVFLLLFPAVVWHFFVLDVGRAALLATISVGVLVAGLNWHGSWEALLAYFIGGCLAGLGPALFVGYVYYNVGGEERRRLAARQFASNGRRRHLVGGIGGIAIGLAALARFGLDASPRAILGYVAFVGLGVATLAWLWATRGKRGN